MTELIQRQLNEQWVEEIDGVKHMYKVLPCKDGNPCLGCDFGYFDMDVEHVRIHICSCKIRCDDNGKYIIKDLGVLCDGFLPEERTGLYPEIENLRNETFIVSVRTDDVIVICYGNTLQEAKDAWNRRA